MKMVSDGNLEQAVMKIQQEIERVRIMIAGVYSSGTAYAVGDFCIYDEVLYRCTTAIPSGEAWDSTHWEVAVAGKVDIATVAELKTYLGIE